MGKKSLFVVLVLALLLAACGGKETPDAEGELVTITFACEDHQRGRYKELAKDFEDANPDIRVHLISANEASGRQGQGGRVTISGDVFERLTAAADTFVWLAALRPDEWSFLLDLEPFIDDPSFPLDDFYPGTLDHFRRQRGIYGLPAEIMPILIFYDRRMFDEVGAPHPHIGWTWDDFIDAATQLTEREGDAVKRYGFVDA
jgi:multiple sugar transport system substrate-binding protein